MAFANEHITAYAVEATEFPDLARKYRDHGRAEDGGQRDQIEILGGIPQDEFIQQALADCPRKGPPEHAEIATLTKRIATVFCVLLRCLRE